MPMEPSIKLKRDDGQPFSDPAIYRRLIWQLLYLTTTRPNISFVVTSLSQLLQAPIVAHHQATFRIFRYLKNAPMPGLFFPSSSDLHLKGFSNSD